MKRIIKINEIELYPFFTFEESLEPTNRFGFQEIDSETIDRWNTVMEDFRAVQEEMDTIINGEDDDE